MQDARFPCHYVVAPLSQPVANVVVVRANLVGRCALRGSEDGRGRDRAPSPKMSPRPGLSLRPFARRRRAAPPSWCGARTGTRRARGSGTVRSECGG